MRIINIFLLIHLLACAEPSTLLLGTTIQQTPFNPIDETAGIYPSVSVLTDPENYFRNNPPDETAKWDVQSYGDPKLSYYAFASALTRVPTGENQFYVGINLKRMLTLDLVSPGKEGVVRRMTVAAFQTVIDQFPNDLTFDADGVTSHRVADFAMSELQDL